MDDALRERVEALERAVTDGDHDLSAFADEAAALDRLDTLESQVEEIDERVEELEAATQALRGYVGNVRSVNADVEQRADAALAKAESLESAVMDPGASDAAPVPDERDDNRVETDRGPGDSTGSTDHVPGDSTGSTDHVPGDGAGRIDRTAATDEAIGVGTGPSDGGTDAADTDKGQRTTGGSSVEQSGSGIGGTGTTIDLGTGDTDRGFGGTDDPVAGDHERDSGLEPEVQTPRGRSGDSGPARADDRRCQECGRPHTTGDAPGGGENAGSIGGESDSAPGEDVVPDGETDPFVGAAGGNGTDEAGTLQRIRDLL
jgi:hypothetical protein